MHHAREETYCAGEPGASKPAEHLLRTVREEDNSQHQSQNRRRAAVIRSMLSFGFSERAHPSQVRIRLGVS